MRTTLCTITILSLAIGCNSSEKIDAQVDKIGRATGPTPATQGAPHDKMGMGQMPTGPMAQGSGVEHTGTVTTAIDASRYTYLEIKPQSGESIWAAVPQAKIEKGATVTVMESLVMKDFKSPTLKRTFKAVVFGVLKDAPQASGGDFTDQNNGTDAGPSAKPVDAGSK